MFISAYHIDWQEKNKKHWDVKRHKAYGGPYNWLIFKQKCTHFFYSGRNHFQKDPHVYLFNVKIIKTKYWSNRTQNHPEWLQTFNTTTTTTNNNKGTNQLKWYSKLLDL